MKPLRQFFSYYGSKVGLSKNYPAPEFKSIVEPFAGSAGYACRYPDLDVRLFDVDPVIAGIWQFLIRATAADILALPLDPAEINKVTNAESDLIRFWWRRAGVNPCGKPVPWMRSGKYPWSFWGEKTRARIAAQVHRVNHWSCDLASYQFAPPLRATWFIDPPYQVQGRKYIHGSRAIDYAALALWVKSLPGQKIVCEAPGAVWLPFRPLFENHTVRCRKFSTEMVYP